MSEWDEPRCVDTEASDVPEAPSLMPAVTEGEFDDFLGSSSGFVLVDFWADWCGPCHALAPVLEELAVRYEGQIRVAKVNADHNRRLMDAFGVRSLPTVLLLKPRPQGGAQVVDHRVGVRAGSDYAQMIDKALNPAQGILGKITRLFGG